jgi:hypothetical protein
LADLSLRVYLPVATNLLKYLENKHGTAAFRRLDATIVRSFLFERAQDRSSEYVRLLAISLPASVAAQLESAVGEPNRFWTKPCRDDFITRRRKLGVPPQPHTLQSQFARLAANALSLSVQAKELFYNSRD